MKRALIVQGGLPLHKPREVAEIFGGWLREREFEVNIVDDFECFRDQARMNATDLVVLNWHLGDLNWKLGWIEPEQVTGLTSAVRAGTGIAGIHAGLGDAFRNEVEFQYMIGGQWVAHPGDDGVSYRVEIVDRDGPITRDIDDFMIASEQYFMHVDPSIHVLAVTRFGQTAMPIAWTKTYEQGRVFYCSLGHTPEIVCRAPVAKMVARGFEWAAR